MSNHTYRRKKENRCFVIEIIFIGDVTEAQVLKHITNVDDVLIPKHHGVASVTKSYKKAHNSIVNVAGSCQMQCVSGQCVKKCRNIFRSKNCG